MSAGDLVNNLGKLELKLKQFNFRDFRRSELLSGSMDIYVSIYGYVFSDYNRELSKLIASHELELYGKTTKRFVDNLYLIVRDVLHYKPPITKDMFLSKCGFVEMKMIMCTQILELIVAKCKEFPRPPSDRHRKHCRKPENFSSSSTRDSNGKTKNINNVSSAPTDDPDCENANSVSTSSTLTDCIASKPSLSRLSSMQNPTIQANEKRSNSFTKNGYTGQDTNTAKPKKQSSCHQHHLSSHHTKSVGGPVSPEIQRHSISNDCAIAKNPVTKYNVGRTSYSKGKAVILEKQEPPPKKVEIKVLKGPLQIDDEFSGVPWIIPPDKLSSCDFQFCQNFIPSARNLVTFNHLTPAELSTSIATGTIPNSTITTMTNTIPKSTECDITIPGSDGFLPDFQTSSTINKPQKVCPSNTDSIPISTSNEKSKCSLEDEASTESRFVENTTVTTKKPPGDNNQLKEINLLDSNRSHTARTTKVAETQKSRASDSERTQALKTLSQIKNLSQNLTGCADTLRQMQERSRLWETQNALRNSLERNKENAPTIYKESIPVGYEIEQGSVDVSGTKESEDQAHQMDYWIAKMNLMECAVKSLESKFKSL